MSDVNMFSAEERKPKPRKVSEKSPCLRGQQERISRLFASGAPWMLANFGKYALSDLTRGEAAQMIAAMERFLIKRDQRRANGEES
jgi:hypothetical protein